MATSATDTTSHDKLLKAFIHNGWWGKHWEEKVTRAVLSTPFNGEYSFYKRKKRICARRKESSRSPEGFAYNNGS